MKISINTASAFRDQFHRMGRGEQFSYKGLQVLFEYLEDVNPEYELDVVALCCDFTESSIDDALKYYSLDSLDDLKDNTQVIEVDDETIIYQNY